MTATNTQGDSAPAVSDVVNTECNIFADLAALPAPFMEPWVEDFFQAGITTGKADCTASADPAPGQTFYCGSDPVTRADMAVFILHALGTDVNDETPNPFDDVPENLPAPFMEPFVETFFTEQITTGKAVCDDGTTPGSGETFYCPQDEVTRGDMAVFILRAFNGIPDPSDP